MKNSCGGCFSLILPACGKSISIPMDGYDAGDTYWILITDKFGNRYKVRVTVEELDGQPYVSLNAIDFPAGLFTPYSGIFTIQIFEDNGSDFPPVVCSWLDFTFCEVDYSCIALSFSNDTVIEGVIPPIPACICAWAFGTTDFKAKVDTFGVIVITLAGEFLGDSSGTFLDYDFSFDRWVGGVYDTTINGSVSSGDTLPVNMGLTSAVGVTFIMRFTFHFSDSAICYFTTILRYVAVTPSKLLISGARLTLLGCNVGNFLLDVVSAGMTTTVAPYYQDGDGHLLEAGLTYEGEVIDLETFVDIAFIYGLIAADWGLPVDFSMDTLGIGSTFIYCEAL